MEFKGTPGPWTVKSEDQVAFSSEDFSVKGCDLYEHQYDDLTEMDANVQLIAAAPDMLEALQLLVKEYKIHGQLLGYDVDIARQAIKKALTIQ